LLFNSLIMEKHTTPVRLTTRGKIAASFLAGALTVSGAWGATEYVQSQRPGECTDGALADGEAATQAVRRTLAKGLHTTATNTYDAGRDLAYEYHTKVANTYGIGIGANEMQPGATFRVCMERAGNEVHLGATTLLDIGSAGHAEFGNRQVRAGQ
jgi:hypothetical protein